MAELAVTVPDTLSRDEVARMAGCSLHVVRYAAAHGKLKERSVLGRYYFERRDVEAWLATRGVDTEDVMMRIEKTKRVQTIVRRSSRTAAITMPDIDGDTAARVFAMFDAGTSPCAVVIRERLTPSLVEALHEQWARLSGRIVVTPDFLAALEALPGYRGDPRQRPRTSAELLAVLQASLEATCANCSAKASLCERCSDKRARVVASQMRAEERLLEADKRVTAASRRSSIARTEAESPTTTPRQKLPSDPMAAKFDVLKGGLRKKLAEYASQKADDPHTTQDTQR